MQNNWLALSITTVSNGDRKTLFFFFFETLWTRIWNAIFPLSCTDPKEFPTPSDKCLHRLSPPTLFIIFTRHLAGSALGFIMASSCHSDCSWYQPLLPSLLAWPPRYGFPLISDHVMPDVMESGILPLLDVPLRNVITIPCVPAALSCNWEYIWSKWVRRWALEFWTFYKGVGIY